MPTVTAREANQQFSELLAKVEAGEEFIVTKHGKPVAMIRPYEVAAMTPERRAAIQRAIAMMEEGLPWGEDAGPFTRDEMHER